MKFVISKKSLSKMLNMVAETMANVPSKSELKEIVIVAGYNNLYIMGSNLDFSVTVHTLCDVLEIGTIIVDAKTLIEVIKDIDDDGDVITIDEIKDNLVNISAMDTNINVLALDITTYSAIDQETEIYYEVL